MASASLDPLWAAEELTVSRDGYELTASYKVLNCASLEEALLTAPKRGTAPPGHANLLITDATAKWVEQARGRADVHVKAVSGQHASSDWVQRIRWSIGTASQRITKDRDGYQIGALEFWSILQPVGDPAPKVAELYDQDAELCTEVLVSTVELEVQMPLSAAWDPAVAVQMQMNPCNQSDFLVGGKIIPSECGFYHGAEAEPDGENPSYYRVTHRFSIARQALTAGVTYKRRKGAGWTDDDFEAWGKDYIPARWGQYPVRKLVKTVDPDYPNGARRAAPELKFMVVFPAYGVSDWGVLGIQP